MFPAVPSDEYGKSRARMALGGVGHFSEIMTITKWSICMLRNERVKILYITYVHILSYIIYIGFVRSLLYIRNIISFVHIARSKMIYHFGMWIVLKFGARRMSVFATDRRYSDNGILVSSSLAVLHVKPSAKWLVLYIPHIRTARRFFWLSQSVLITYFSVYHYLHIALICTYIYNTKVFKCI
jgi:hypothetical protein